MVCECVFFCFCRRLYVLDYMCCRCARKIEQWQAIGKRCFNEIQASNEHFYRYANIYFNIITQVCVCMCIGKETGRWHKCICASYFKCTHNETAAAKVSAVTVTNRQPKVLSRSRSNLSKIVLAGRWLLILSACTLWTRVYSSTAPVLCSSLCLLMANMLKTTYS